MKNINRKFISFKTLLSVMSILSILAGVLWSYLPPVYVRTIFIASGIVVFLLTFLWDWYQKRQQTDFANDICETLDTLMDGRELSNYNAYEDSQASKVQGKLLQYYECILEGQRQSQQDKQMIPGSVLEYQIISCYVGRNGSAGYTYSFPEPGDFQKFVDTVLSYSGYDTGVAAADTDHIVTLSTCVNTDRNYRYLVHGKLLKRSRIKKEIQEDDRFRIQPLYYGTING